MDNLFILACHFVFSLAVWATALGFGIGIQTLVGQRFLAQQTWRDLVLSTGLGFGGLLALSDLFLTFLPYSVGTPLSLLVTLAAFGYCVYVAAKEAPFRRALFLCGILAGVAFLSAYLPFYSCTRPFVASEGGGDISNYLGMSKIYFHRPPENAVFSPRIFALLDFKNNFMNIKSIFDFPVFKDWEPPELSFYTGLNPLTWGLFWFFSPFKMLIPFDTIYMALLFAMVSALPVLALACIPRALKACSPLLLLVFFFTSFSSALHGVMLNHFVLQLMSMLVIMTLFLLVTMKLEGTQGFVDSEFPFLSLFLLLVLASMYFVAFPWALWLAGTGMLLSVWQGRLPRWNPSVRQYLFFAAILAPFPAYIECGRRALQAVRDFVQVPTPAVLAQLQNTFGTSVKSWAEGSAVVFGAWTHNFLEPYTHTQAKHLLSFKAAPLLLVFAVLVCFFGVLAIEHSVRVKCKAQGVRDSLWLFWFFVLLGTAGLCVVFRRMTYPFDKAATLSTPLIFVALPCLYVSLCERVRQRDFIYRFLGITGVALAFLWCACLLQARMAQVRDFEFSENRTAIVYTDFLQGPLLTARPTKTFIYSRHPAGTDYFLLEGAAAGLQTFPMNQYRFPGGYFGFLQRVDFSHAGVILPDQENSRFRKYIAVSDLKLPGDPAGFVLPAGPLIDLKSSQFPGHIKLYGKDSLSFVVQSQHVLTIDCLTDRERSNFSFSAKEIPNGEERSQKHSLIAPRSSIFPDRVWIKMKVPAAKLVYVALTGVYEAIVLDETK